MKTTMNALSSRRYAALLLLCFSCVTALSCSDEAVSEKPTQPDGVEDAGSDASLPDRKDDSAQGDVGQGDTNHDEPDASDCDRNEIPLTVVTYGETDRFYADVEIDGETRLFQVDTGSGLTFEDLGADGPAYVPVSSVGLIGCERVEIAGRGLGLSSPDVEGRAVEGIIGMDFLLGKPSVLDTERAQLVRLSALPQELIERDGAFSISFDRVLDHALVPLELDGEELRLLFDTGAAHTMHVGVEGNDGDDVYYVQDAQGNSIPVWIGQAELKFPGQSAFVVPVERAPEFPYFEGTIEALGGNLHGLLGVSAFDGRILVFEGSDDRFWSIPRL